MKATIMMGELHDISRRVQEAANGLDALSQLAHLKGVPALYYELGVAGELLQEALERTKRLREDIAATKKSGELS